MTYLPSLVPIGPVDCEKQIVMLKSNGHKVMTILIYPQMKFNRIGGVMVSVLASSAVDLAVWESG